MVDPCKQSLTGSKFNWFSLMEMLEAQSQVDDACGISQSFLDSVNSRFLSLLNRRKHMKRSRMMTVHTREQNVHRRDDSL